MNKLRLLLPVTAALLLASCKPVSDGQPVRCRTVTISRQTGQIDQGAWAYGIAGCSALKDSTSFAASVFPEVKYGLQVATQTYEGWMPVETLWLEAAPAASAR